MRNENCFNPKCNLIERMILECVLQIVKTKDENIVHLQYVSFPKCVSKYRPTNSHQIPVCFYYIFTFLFTPTDLM